MGKAHQMFRENLGSAMSFLSARGITSETAERFGLGVVPDGVKGYEQYYGRLVIPYVDRSGVYGFKFRCMALHDCKAEDCAKYLNPEGQELGLFNVLALDSDSEILHVCEGEIDTIVLAQIVPDPVIGLPGADVWRDHFPFHMAGFERVCLWPDGDRAGKDMGKAWLKKLRTVEIMRIPNGHDVNSVFCAQGAGFFTEALQEGDQ